MKKTLLTLAAVLSFGFAAQAQTTAAELAGAYEGQLYIALEEEITAETEAIDYSKVDLSEGNGGAVDFALYNFGFLNMNLGNIELKELSISDNDGKVVFGEKAPVEIVFNTTPVIEATAAINAEKSYVKGDSIVVYVDVIWTNNVPAMPINVLFKGVKMQSADLENVTGDLFVDNKAEAAIANMNVRFEASALGACSYDLVLEGVKIGEADWGNLTFPATTIGFVGENLVIGNINGVERTFVKIVNDKEIEDYEIAKLNSAACSWKNDELTLVFEIYDSADQLAHTAKFVSKTATPLPTAIESVVVASAAKGVYNVAGVYVGASVENLPAGLYIVDGVKTLVK